jgi:hypothetical protein
VEHQGVFHVERGRLRSSRGNGNLTSVHVPGARVELVLSRAVDENDFLPLVSQRRWAAIIVTL